MASVPVKIEFNKDAYRSAVNLFARTGDLSKVQQFAITSGTASGAYLPKEVLQPVQVRRLPNAIRALLSYYDIHAHQPHADGSDFDSCAR